MIFPGEEMSRDSFGALLSQLSELYTGRPYKVPFPGSKRTDFSTSREPSSECNVGSDECKVEIRSVVYFLGGLYHRLQSKEVEELLECFGELHYFSMAESLENSEREEAYTRGILDLSQLVIVITTIRPL